MTFVFLVKLFCNNEKMRRSGNLALIKRKHNNIYKIFLIIPLSLSLILFYETFDKYLLFVLKKNLMFTQYSFVIKISRIFDPA